MKCFTVAKILRVLKPNCCPASRPFGFTVAKILRVLKPKHVGLLSVEGFTVAKILRVLKLFLRAQFLKYVLQ